MYSLFRHGAIGAAILSWAPAGVFAQTTGTLDVVTVTANPLGSADLIAPATSLGGTGLLLRAQPTLGETLSGVPGVSSTYFGPNASRPVIRGLDGDRIRILSNSGSTLDASGLSFDHAVTADPLSVERIEVLRGPGALLYGGNAVGGVVNLIDNRIPKEPVDSVTGKADIGFATANREAGGGVLIEGGNARVGLHVDAWDRRTQDVSVPVLLPCTQGEVTRHAYRICNSPSHVRGGALGGSVFFDQGHVGASVATYRNDYGTPAEDEVTLGMRSNRYALEGEWRLAGAWLKSVKAQASHTDYAHTEFDAGEPGTRFKNKGSDWRLETRHAKLGALEGVIGVQGDNTRFSADGDEAFAPYSRTRQHALFVLEELGLSWGKLSFGGRVERVSVESLGNPQVDRFVVGRRAFNPASMALGALWNVAPAWQLTGNLSRSERAPKDHELFANGPHVATGAWESGNAALGKERSTQLDLGLQWKSGPRQAKLAVFSNRFDNYISLEATGEMRDDLPEFAYRPVRARFQGMEAQGTVRLLDGLSTVDLELRGDLVRATNLDTGQPLPRIAPVRVGATLAWARGPWGARIGLDHAARQDRVPEGERTTAAYTLWNAALTWKTRAGATEFLWYARLDNIGNRLAYSANSILTQTAPGKSPLPGRSLRLGLQAHF